MRGMATACCISFFLFACPKRKQKRPHERQPEVAFYAPAPWQSQSTSGSRRSWTSAHLAISRMSILAHRTKTTYRNFRYRSLLLFAGWPQLSNPWTAAVCWEQYRHCICNSNKEQYRFMAWVACLSRSGCAQAGGEWAKVLERKEITVSLEFSFGSFLCFRTKKTE